MEVVIIEVDLEIKRHTCELHYSMEKWQAVSVTCGPTELLKLESTNYVHMVFVNLL